MTFQSTEKCPHASCQGSSWFNLTSVIGSGQGCFRGECHHTEWEVCHSLGVHHPSWHYLEVHCQLIDVSQSLGPLWSLSAPQSLWGARVHPFPQQAADAETATANGAPSHISEGWVSSHPGSRVYSTFKTLWELLACNCDVSLECDVAGKQSKERRPAAATCQRDLPLAQELQAGGFGCEEPGFQSQRCRAWLFCCL